MADSYSRLANSTRHVTILKILFVFLSVLFVALIITLTVVLTSKRAKDSLNDRSLKFCPENTKLTVSTARSYGLYDDLSEKEIISMRDFILSQTSLNITPLKDANVNDNHIYLIELQQPNKDKAIKFLDNNDPKPERVARVVVFSGGKLSPEVRKYLVCPTAKPSRYEEPQDLSTNIQYPMTHARIPTTIVRLSLFDLGLYQPGWIWFAQEMVLFQARSPRKLFTACWP